MWRMWQLLDSAFPTGGFAHSAGVEAVYRSGLFLGPRGSEALEAHLLGSATSSLSLLAPFLTVAHRAVECSAGDMIERLAHAHETLDTHLVGNPVARRASLAAGSALVRACGAAFDASSQCSAVVAALHARGDVHHAVALGACSASLGVALPAAMRALLFLQLRDGCAAACRLGVLGPMAAAHLQARLAPVCEALIAEWTLAQTSSTDADYDEALLSSAGGAYPLGDALQSGHDALFTRLFQS